jgi:plasmid maintenance system killer protein
MPDIKSDENIIKLKMIVLSTIRFHVKLNYWDREKNVLRSNPEGVISIRVNCQRRLTKKAEKVS